MRTLKLQVQMTIDGYIASPNGEMDWVVWDWDDKLKAYVADLTEPVDCIVLGRNLAGGFIPHWANVAADPDHPEHEDGKKFSDTRKVVFSKTLSKSEWENTSLATGDLVDEIISLKKQAGGDIIAYGGSDFISSLIKHDLVDEYNLFINPVALGDGMAIFNELESKKAYFLEESIAFPCGIVVIKYSHTTLPSL